MTKSINSIDNNNKSLPGNTSFLKLSVGITGLGFNVIIYKMLNSQRQNVI